MDSGVSWPEAIMLSKARFPKADLETTMHLAKQIYLSSISFNIKEALKNKPEASPLEKQNKSYVLQGAHY
jgi:hypothetical protein